MLIAGLLLLNMTGKLSERSPCPVWLNLAPAQASEQRRHDFTRMVENRVRHTVRTEALMDRDAYLLHQVHAAKLATDISADVASTWLMWHRRVPAALVASFLPAAAASAVLIRRDLSGIRNTRRGRYVLAHMPPSAQAIRLAGLVMLWRAAYRHRLAGIAAGHVLVAVGWSHGLLALLPATKRSQFPHQRFRGPGRQRTTT